MTNYKRGDVILALFPDSNLQTAKKTLGSHRSSQQSANKFAANNRTPDKIQISKKMS
jgi:hypothetical protein